MRSWTRWPGARGYLLVALVGSSFDQVVAGLGWALASSSIIAWSGSLLTRRLLASRGRPEISGA